MRHYSWAERARTKDEAAPLHRHTKGSGDPVGKRILSAIAATVTAALLSSCAPATSQAPETDTEVAATTQAELPPGFYLGEEFIEIGGFNPNKVELIDLCEEIPDEVLLEAGIDPSETISSEFHRSIICSPPALDPEDEYGTFGLITDSLTKEVIKEEGYMINADVNSVVPEVFLYHTGPDKNFSCSASVPTQKSLMTVTYKNMFADLEQEKLCDQALEALASIYIQLRGK